MKENIKLAPPGAGIGFLPELYLKLYVKPFVTRKASWESCEQNFKKMHSKILETLNSIPKDKMDVPILVPPQRGLEDSSRYWSAKMVVEHILIVGTQVQDAIVKLSNGEKIDTNPKTEDVKPKGDSDLQITLNSFTHFVDEVPTFLNKNVKDRNSKTELRHPWFGMLNCKDWYWILGIHAGIHYKQLKAVATGLKENMS